MVRRGWTSGVAVAAACAACAVSAGPASANENVLAAIQQQNRIVLGSGIVGRIQYLLHRHRSRAVELKLARAFESYGAKIDHAASVVSHASADSARQAAGRRDWVLAARDIGAASIKEGHAFADVAHGHAGAARRLIARAERERAAASAESRKASRLLG